MLLSKALQRGYGSKYIEDDSDLDNVRDMPGFKAMVRTVGLGKMSRQTEDKPNPIPEFIGIESTPSPNSAPTGLEK